ncbi:hypothetical protein DBR43_01215 [Pedobacter sp. KBW06]|uniref:hypothetical protein n=1 Tax=Pedobacter sp. KBW06 TaxID=2153359 RepID=UPI000F5A0BD1|nr:hypothetical protein [Pedobacter sp. KBW06]RQO74055.1 hypothetical protein DBR43_01215 [Pedobacter sp. KBW06]
MKDNGFMIDSDGICLFITLTLRTSLAGRLVLIFLNMMCTGIIVLAAAERITALILASTVIFLLLIRYSLWNFYGKEYLTINTKSIRYQHDYGFFKTTPQINKIGTSLMVQAQNIYQTGKPKQVRLVFISHNELDFPEEVYHVAIPITQKNANAVIRGINLLYLDKVTDDYSLPPIHMN